MVPNDELRGIKNFHAHVYFDPATRTRAERVHEGLAGRFDVKVGDLVDRPVGPHAKPMFQVTIAPEQFATLVPWLMLNRDGLSILVHPTTHDPVADHETNPLWMGEQLALDVEAVRRFIHSADANRVPQHEERSRMP